MPLRKFWRAARYLLDHPEQVAGRFVLDFGAGSGLVAIAAAKAGAARVLAADIDRFAAAAIAMNAAVNNVRVAVTTAELIDTVDEPWGVVTAGDVCYEQPMAERVASWLRRLAQRGCLVLLGDPVAPTTRPITCRSAPGTRCQRAAI